MATRAIPVPGYGTNTDYNSFSRYIELVNSGVPPFQALREAFPQGMMTPEERAKQLGKQQQSGALGQIGGMGVGLLGAKALQDALAGQKVLGGLREGLFGAEGTTGQGIGSRLADAFNFGGGGATAGTTSSGVSGIGPVASGTEYAGMLGQQPGMFASAAPYAVPIMAAIAAGVTYNRASKKYKTASASEGAKAALKDPLTYLIPSNLLGAAFGDKDRYLTEHRRLLDLQQSGVNVPESLLAGTRLERGRSKAELVAAEEAKKARGEYSNVEFAQSRDEKLLKPEDIWGYSAFMKKYGNDWFNKFNEQQRRDIAQRALDAGAVREHHGTIDIDWAKVPEVATPPAAQPQQQQKQKRK